MNRPDTRATPPLAAPGRPRDLSSEEWHAIERLRRGKWPAAVFAGVVLLGLAGAVVYMFLARRPADRDTTDVVVTVLFGGVFGAFGLAALAAPLWPRQERPGGRPRRVGYHRGLVNVVGKPAKLTVGGIWVNVPRGWPLGLMDDVEVEIVPPLEEYANRRALRTVVSAFGGRLRITDPDTRGA